MSFTKIITLAAIFVAVPANAQRWSMEKAKQWQEENPWYCGVNYIPANAINYTAMWDKTSFSPKVIQRELALMTEIGLNCVRFVMQYKVYEDDPKYFIKTFDRFLSICEKAGVKAMPIFFDDCMFGTNTDPHIGKQSDPLEGWYAWDWSPSPGLSMTVDERCLPLLEKYVKDVMSHFKDDKRILLWDLYNEPTNNTMGNCSWPLVRGVFKWAREINPIQPISSGLWNDNQELNDFLAANSDVITFHTYSSPEATMKHIKEKKAYGRPVICTEWMNRTVGSTIKDNLHLFAENNVSCILWGLVNGKTQTHLPWGHRPDMNPYTGVWQHDIFRGDYTPYNQDEINLLSKTMKEMK